MEHFIKSMPKIELHAHLNGSFTFEILDELSKIKFENLTSEYEVFKKKYFNLKEFSSKTFSECFEIFKIAHELISDLELLEKGTSLVIKEFYSDNVIYLELRTTPKKNNNFTKQEYLETIIKSIKQSQTLYPEICVKLIVSFDRARGVADAEDTLNVVTELIKTHKDIIVGIDISGDPLANAFTEFKTLLSKARQIGLKLTLHCAEVQCLEEETKEMIDFGMERLGHGTFIKDEFLNLLKQKDICIECCLTSNIKCGTVKTYSEHHINEIFLKNNVPVVICTDDCGVFNTNLSKEFLIAVDTFGLTENDLIKLSMNAINYSFANEADKILLENKIEKYFKNIAK